MSKRRAYEIQPSAAEPPLAWRSLDALEDPAAVQARAAVEFPLEFEPTVGDAADIIESDTVLDDNTRDGLGRRNFLTLSGAAAAAIGAAGCVRRPNAYILPHSHAPEFLNPGVPIQFATVHYDRGDAVGTLVASHDGRPTKLEGNRDHTASVGALSLQGQASIMDLYDPDRVQHVTKRSGGKVEATDLNAFETELLAAVREHAATGGEGLRFLAEPTNSPTFMNLRARVAAAFPRAKFYTWTGASDTYALEGARIAFGEPVRVLPAYDVQGAVIVAIDSDFLMTEPGATRATRRFADGRRMASSTGTMNRLYAIESTHSVTGATADHRLGVSYTDCDRFLVAVAVELLKGGLAQPAALAGLQLSYNRTPNDRFTPLFVSEVARELREGRGKGFVVVGSRQPPYVHALAHAINAAVGANGTTVFYAAAVDPLEHDHIADITELTREMRGGSVKTLIMFGGNPVYDAPAETLFADALAKVGRSIHLSAHSNDTGKLTGWTVPRPHELEAWGDQRSFDQTYAVQQPLISPLFAGYSDIEVLALMLAAHSSPQGQTVPSALPSARWRGYDLVRDTLRSSFASNAEFENKWRELLHRGSLNSPSAKTPTLDLARVAAARTGLKLVEASSSGLEGSFLVDNKLVDGRHGNNPWLLELPDPMTRISWGNAALLAPETAKKLGVANDEVVRVEGNGAWVELPVWVFPGQPVGVVGLPMGWGRETVGRYGKGHGHNVLPLRKSSDSLYFVRDVKVTKTGRKEPVVQTQEHHSMEGRPISIDASLAEYRQSPDFAQYRSPTPRTLPLWKERVYAGHRWGMTIDLTTCTGCNACVIACQSENNTPTVGKEMVQRGREMHWLRIDRYFVGSDPNEPQTAFQPLACQQCEEAPCENVCPVAATTHSPEGLNDMAYNRCIGTRYCMNNCPYKVRRYNYVNYHTRELDTPMLTTAEVPELRKMQFNPNVTVRMRGVVEKCNYCVQRIESTRIRRRAEGLSLRDGDITPACAQTCPAGAITFGDLNDPSSRVAKAAATDRQYKLLGEIGTQPRTTFLARIRNLNPTLAGAKPAAYGPSGGHHG